ncbi:MAG TPA: class I SAM-dependent methyltransferase [Longimicrobiales bacterium]
MRNGNGGPMTILDLGCGPNKHEGAIGLDRVALPGVDVVHDLDSFPYPFADDTFDVVYAMSVLEHLVDFLGAMEEIHRILKPGGRLIFETPHFSGLNSWTDPTHRQHFAIRSFAFFEPDFKKNYYTKARFRTAWLRVDMHSPWRQIGVQWLINRSRHRPYARGLRRFWEEHLAFLLRARGLRAELTAVKGE